MYIVVIIVQYVHIFACCQSDVPLVWLVSIIALVSLVQTIVGVSLVGLGETSSINYVVLFDVFHCTRLLTTPTHWAYSPAILTTASLRAGSPGLWAARRKKGLHGTIGFLGSSICIETQASDTPVDKITKNSKCKQHFDLYSFYYNTIKQNKTTNGNKSNSKAFTAKTGIINDLNLSLKPNTQKL